MATKTIDDILNLIPEEMHQDLYAKLHHKITGHHLPGTEELTPEQMQAFISKINDMIVK